ncbi:hypothetical protein [Paenibacillus sonchi]|uniref:hypothetical protein n=1 Tax=Paenibacillus sonchi TaxID=373687 RepID=UPI001E2C95F5|nr:hypothetical protein [Paenibacillus sonchi]MCE3199589.1 hypothetical protein [Paenibacillus sonchi]
MKKLLPVNQPLISSYPYYAGPLAILASRGNHYIPWVLSNFIQLSLDNDYKLDFFQPWITWKPYECPFLDVQIINRDVFSRQQEQPSGIVEEIINAIDRGYYVYLKVNHRYLSISSNWYQQIDNAHELLIYGYCKVSESFQVADNFGGKYDFKSCPFDEFIQSCTFPPSFNIDHYNKIILMKPLENVFLGFDLLRVIDSLRDYLESRTTEIRNDLSINWARNIVVGIRIYQKIEEYIESLIEQPDKKLDHRIFHVLWEHKCCMTRRIEYMRENGLLTDEIILIQQKELETKALLFRNHALKYNITEDIRIIKKMLKEVNPFAIQEANLISHMVEHICDINSKTDYEHILGTDLDYNSCWFLAKSGKPGGKSNT